MKAHLPNQGTKAQKLKAASEEKKQKTACTVNGINEFCAQEYIIEKGHSKAVVCPLLLVFLVLNHKIYKFFN